MDIEKVIQAAAETQIALNEIREAVAARRGRTWMLAAAHMAQMVSFGVDTTAEQVAIDRLRRRLWRAYHGRGKYGT